MSDRQVPWIGELKDGEWKLVHKPTEAVFYSWADANAYDESLREQAS